MAGHDQVERYEEQANELRSQVKFLEEEVGLLRRRLSGSPRQVAVLEEKLSPLTQPGPEFRLSLPRESEGGNERSFVARPHLKKAEIQLLAPGISHCPG